MQQLWKVSATSATQELWCPHLAHLPSCPHPSRTPTHPPRCRLWDLRDLVASGSTAAAPSLSGATATSLSGCTNDAGGVGTAGGSGRTRPVCTYTGHRNQRNFVGLSVSPAGHILCGSEDNAVYSYYRSLPFPTASYQFPDAGSSGGAPGGGSGSSGAHQPFVSAVCWANNSRHCLAANSQGLLQILELE